MVESPSPVTPNYLIPKLRSAEDTVHHGFEIVRLGRVTMKVDAASGFEQAPHLNQPNGHHR